MTIQMRQGWVLLRNESVDYAEPNVAGEFVKTHPWRLRRSRLTIRDDGRFSACLADPDADEDVVELLDPWDARVPEEHREKRFVVGWYRTRGGNEWPCVFDRKTMQHTASAWPEGAEQACRDLNQAFSQKRLGSYSWVAGSMLTLDGKPCNPDGSPIAETPAEVEATPEPVKTEPFKVVDPPVKTEPFKVVDQPVVKTRTLDACGWRVYGIIEGDDHPRVVLEPDDRDNKLSLEAARAYAAAILAVCEEIER